MSHNAIAFKQIRIQELTLAYRESGPADAPVVLLLHGEPGSALMFSSLIPLLDASYRVIAPDLPVFASSSVPPPAQDRLAAVLQQFIDALGLARFVLYIFDDGAPVGLRLAAANPEKVAGLITQKGNGNPAQSASNPAQVISAPMLVVGSNRDDILSFLRGIEGYDAVIPNGVTVKASSLSVKESIDRMETFLEKAGVTIYARIDQRNELKKVGLSSRAIEFILFGNPKAGGPVMQENPIAALDLPLKVIAYEDAQGKVWLAYNQGSYLRERYGLAAAASAPLNLDGLISKVFGS
jgi:pimeloyl-ACP methyl ester carboxylesterase